MQSISTTFALLLAAGAPKEVRATIAGTVYGQDKIVSAVTRSSMLGRKAASIGNCVAKELTLVLRDYGDIPRMAEILIEIRLNNGTTQSEWLPKGTYYIDTRSDDDGVLTINAFDAMLMGETDYIQVGESVGTWPKTDIQTAQEIAGFLGVTLDPRTVALMTKEYEIQFPGVGESAYTRREVLGFIGSAYAGNWVITDEDKLRLLVLGDIPPESTNLLVTETGDYITIGGYRIRVSR